MGAKILELSYKKTRGEITDFDFNRSLFSYGFWNHQRIDTRHTQGIIGGQGFDHKTLSVFLEGTNEIEDWEKNLYVLTHEENGIKFHEGFKKYGEKVLEQIELNLMDNQVDVRELILYGHSLGGAALFYIAYYVRQHLKFKGQIHMVTFGSPRALKARGRAKWYEKTGISTYTQYVNEGDVVPLIPSFFKHTDNVVLLKENEAVYYNTFRVLIDWFKMKLFKKKKVHGIESYIESLERLGAR